MYIKVNEFLNNYQFEKDFGTSDNNEYLNELNNIFNELMSKYNEVRALDWHDNNVLITAYFA